MNNAPRVRDVWRWSLASASSVFNSWHWHSHIHKTILYVLGVVPRAKLLYFTEDLLNMSLMCCLRTRGGGKKKKKSMYKEELDTRSNENEIRGWNERLWVGPYCVLLQHLLFDIWWDGQLHDYYLVASTSKWDFVAGVCVHPQPRMTFQCLRALTSEITCFHIIALLCATENVFCTRSFSTQWWVET